MKTLSAFFVGALIVLGYTAMASVLVAVIAMFARLIWTFLTASTLPPL